MSSVPRPFRFALQPVSANKKLLQDRDALRECVIEAEALGFDEVYVPDHFGSVDPFIACMVIAEASPTIRVGTLVLNNEFHQPAMLARTAATIDRLTGGRLTLGLGTGYMQAEHDATGIELRSPGARVDRFGESVEVLRGLLDSGAAEFSGGHHRVAVTSLGVMPVQSRLPLLIGGHGRRVVGIAGRFADIYQYTGLTHGEGGIPAAGGFALADVVPRRAWLEAAAGDRIDDIECSTLVQSVTVTNNSSKAIAEASAEIELPQQVVEETPFLLIGSVDQIVEKLLGLRDLLGISHVVVRDAVQFAQVVAALTGR